MATAIKVRQPSTFSGEVSEFGGWIISFQNFLDVNKISNEDAVKIAGSYLSGRALILYEITTSRNPSILWPELKAVLCRTFDIISQDNPMVIMTNRVYNPSVETLAEFYIDKLQLIEKLNVKMSDSDRVAHLISGLDINSQTLLSLRSDISVSNFLSVAQKVVRCQEEYVGTVSATNNHPSQSATNMDLRNLVQSVVKECFKEYEQKSAMTSYQNNTSNNPIMSNTMMQPCIFCNKNNHSSSDCFYNPKNYNSNRGFRYNNYRGNRGYRNYHGYRNYGNYGVPSHVYNHGAYNVAMSDVEHVFPGSYDQQVGSASLPGHVPQQIFQGNTPDAFANQQFVYQQQQNFGQNSQQFSDNNFYQQPNVNNPPINNPSSLPQQLPTTMNRARSHINSRRPFNNFRGHGAYNPGPNVYDPALNYRMN